MFLCRVEISKKGHPVPRLRRSACPEGSELREQSTKKLHSMFPLEKSGKVCAAVYKVTQVTMLITQATVCQPWSWALSLLKKKIK